MFMCKISNKVYIYKNKNKLEITKANYSYRQRPSELKEVYIQGIPKSSPAHQDKSTRPLSLLQIVSVYVGATRHHSKHTHGKLELVCYDGNGYHKRRQHHLPLAPLLEQKMTDITILY